MNYFVIIKNGDRCYPEKWYNDYLIDPRNGKEKKTDLIYKRELTEDEFDVSLDELYKTFMFNRMINDEI